MDRTVYFADRAVLFARTAPGPEWYALPVLEGLSRTKVTKILETNNCVALLSDDPDAAFAAFAAEFAQVEAAGGIAVDAAGAWLMMRRHGRWDLPKGHIEAGETPEVCAERELLEETGIVARTVRPLCCTLHAYWFAKTERWELKRTHWFVLRAVGGTPAPQREEGVECVAWCGAEEVEANLRDTFPTIRRVAEAMRR